MSKTAKILILLTFLALCLVLYLIFSARVVTIQSNKTKNSEQANTEQKKADLVKLTNEYKKDVRKILRRWGEIQSQLITKQQAANLNLVASNTSEFIATTTPPEIISTSTAISAPTSTKEILDRLAALKINLMSTRVPEQFKNFHLKLVVELSELKSALLAKDEQSKKETLDKINTIIEEYRRIIE